MQAGDLQGRKQLSELDCSKEWKVEAWAVSAAGPEPILSFLGRRGQLALDSGFLYPSHHKKTKFGLPLGLNLQRGIK